MENARGVEIGVIGLGAMGASIASNLLNAGYHLRVYSRTAAKGRPLAKRGATLVTRPAEAASAGGVVISMVADDQALKTITEGHDGILGRLGEGGVHLSMSTVSPELARRLADVHAAIGELYVSAPVFGRPDAAVAGQLWICVSGNPDAVHRVMPILQTAGQGVFQFGRDPGMALVAKLAGNTLIVAAIEAMAEAYALAERHGLDPQALADVFNGTFLACPVYRNYGRMIAAKRFSPTGMRLALGLKDTSMALDLAHARQVPMPILSLVHDRLLASVSKGRGEIDWAGLALETFEACGIIVTAEDPPPGTT